MMIIKGKCERASVSGQAKSQIIDRPPAQSMSVDPSGRVPSPPLIRPGAQGLQECAIMSV